MILSSALMHDKGQGLQPRSLGPPLTSADISRNHGVFLSATEMMMKLAIALSLLPKQRASKSRVTALWQLQWWSQWWVAALL